ncbi:MAG: hypothetical protein HQL90_14110 [Magnetococcales bacterium]|nr:hypothetical protein [Magnetococcales bacterium]
MSIKKYWYKGGGVVHARPYASPTDPLRPLCNSSELKVDIKTKTEELPDYDGPSGGLAATSSRIEGADVTLTLYDLNYANLAMAYWGSTAAVAAGSVSGEVVVANPGSLTRLAFVGAANVVVTDASGSITYVLGVDYTLTGAGLLIPDTTTIPAGASIHVAYTYGDQAVVEAMTDGAKAMYLLLDGINSAMDGKPRVVDLWKVQFEAGQGIDYKGDKFATLQLKGKLLRDDTQTGAGASKFFRETIVP